MIAEGDKAPALTWKDHDGRLVKLSSFKKGKVELYFCKGLWKFNYVLLSVPLMLFLGAREIHSRPQTGKNEPWLASMSASHHLYQPRAISDGDTVLYAARNFRIEHDRSLIRSHLNAPIFRPISLNHSGTRILFTAWPSPKDSAAPGQIDWLFPVAGMFPQVSPLQLKPMSSTLEIKPSPFLKWLGLGAFWWAAFFDHYRDAIQDAGGGKTHIFGADTRHWHLIKNLAQLGYLTTGFAAGMELGQKKVTVIRLAWRMVGSVMIYWFIQNIVYDKALHNVWFDYERKYTTDGIVIFDLKGRDHRIELSKWARPLLDVVRVVGGMYLVIKN